MMKFKSLFILLLAILVILPTLSAREVYSLNSGWRIFSATEDSGDDARSVSLPYSWSQSLSTPLSLMTTNYIRNIYAPTSWLNNRVFVKFYGVQSVADLFINGRYVGEHRGGATAFVFEITKFLKYESDNILTMKVGSAPQNDILPISSEHEIYGGIYRDVELIVTPQTAISPVFYGSDGVFVTTLNANSDVVSGQIEAHFLSPDVVERRVEISITDESGVERFNKVLNKNKISANVPLAIPFSIKNGALWSPDSPNLYNVTLSIHSVEKGDKQIAEQTDQVSVTTGFRLVTLAENGGEKGAVRINGEPTPMRGVTLYHDNPTNGGVFTQAAYHEDVEIVKELGANAIRSAVMPHDRYLYSLCDKDGLLVWVDTPLSRAPFFSDVAYIPTQSFETNGLQQLREIIYQNYNHPSIVMWGVFSMLNMRGDDPVRYLNELNTEAKNIDESRLTVGLSDQNGTMNNITDLIVWRQSIGWDSGNFGDVELWRDKLHTEWSNFRSGVMYGEQGARDHQINRDDIAECRSDTRRGWFPEGRQSAMHETYTSVLSADSLFWGTWLTSLFDFKSSRSEVGEKMSGLVEFDRKGRKDAFYLYRALWNKETPTLHIADRRAVYEGDSRQKLMVYASDTIAPIAYYGSDSIEMESVAPSQFVLEGVEVDGNTKVVVKQGDLADSVELIFGSPLRARSR